MIAEQLGICPENVCLLLAEDLGKRKLCCRRVSHRLTPEQMEMRLGACGNLIDMADGDINFLNNIVNGDESWCLREVRSRNQTTKFGAAESVVT
ncbi:uncharacterized protein TNCV_1064851 [Trichonephila clavipes]|nr:uncharacterized protein TNCV_1064851 [Trichonephila clavipes]